MLYFNGCGNHTYTLAATGMKFKTRVFSTRENASYELYKFCGKHGLKIQKVYDDKHDKTYVCGDVRFYISRNY